MLWVSVNISYVAIAGGFLSNYSDGYHILQNIGGTNKDHLVYIQGNVVASKTFLSYIASSCIKNLQKAIITFLYGRVFERFSFRKNLYSDHELKKNF